MSDPTREELTDLTMHAALDGELDAMGMMEFERSLAGNADLAARYEKLVALRAAIRANAGDQRAPDALRARIAAMASGERTGTLVMPVPALRFARRPRLALAAALAMAFVGGGLVTTLIRDAVPGRSDRVALLLVDDHRRALLAREAIDIASSDRHTVKPWFDARLAVSPPVVDLAAQGFALVGGRADVVEGLPAPTLVYRLREHLISLTALPAERFRARAPQAAVNGYETIAWVDGAFAYWAVSDLPRADLESFVAAFRAGARVNEGGR